MPFQQPLTINPAWYWTDSTSFMRTADLSWKMMSPFSRWGRTCILKAKSSLDLFRYLDKNFRRAIPLFALAIDSDICFLKESLPSRKKPRCLVNSCLRTAIPPKKRGGWMPFLYLEVKITSMTCLVISGLNCIFHWEAQAVMVFRSPVRSAWASSMVLTMIKREESSANSLIFELILSVRSLI